MTIRKANFILILVFCCNEGSNTLAYNSTSDVLYTGGYLSTLSPFTVAYGPASVLPLQLISFTGWHVAEKNLLQWHTANEINVKQFKVETSGMQKHLQPRAL